MEDLGEHDGGHERKIKLCLQLCSEHEARINHQYSTLLRVRPDLAYGAAVDLQRLPHAAQDWKIPSRSKRGIVYTPIPPPESGAVWNFCADSDRPGHFRDLKRLSSAECSRASNLTCVPSPLLHQPSTKPVTTDRQRAQHAARDL